MWMFPVANEERGWLRIRPSNRKDGSNSQDELEEFFRTAVPENDERFEADAEKFVTVSLPLPGTRGMQIGVEGAAGEGAPSGAAGAAVDQQ